MAARLPAWIFLSIAMLLIGFALLPLLRVAIGVDQAFSMQFWSVVMLLIGGLMCALTAMILLVRRQPKIQKFNDYNKENNKENNEIDKILAIKMHATGLLLYTGIPLLNFLVCYWLWTRHRTKSAFLDQHGQEVLNFQITVYLYLLLSLFMMLAVIGLLTTPLILALHLVVTLIGILKVGKGAFFSYPANIPIIQGRESIEAE